MNKLLVLFYLALATYKDIKTCTLSIKLTLCFSGIFTVAQLISHQTIAAALYSPIGGIIPGLFVLLLGCITRQAIGYGDGYLLICIGIVLDFRTIFFICVTAFFLSAVAALGILIFRKLKGISDNSSKNIPFIPFILAGYIIWLTL